MHAAAIKSAGYHSSDHGQIANHGSYGGGHTEAYPLPNSLLSNTTHLNKANSFELKNQVKEMWWVLLALIIISWLTTKLEIFDIGTQANFRLSVYNLDDVLWGNLSCHDAPSSEARQEGMRTSRKKKMWESGGTRKWTELVADHNSLSQPWRWIVNKTSPKVDEQWALNLVSSWLRVNIALWDEINWVSRTFYHQVR